MQELKYFQVEVVPTEAKKNPNFASFNGYRKLTTKNKYHHRDPINVENILYCSEPYPAFIKIPSKEIIFYDFYTHHSSKVLDDFMVAPTGDLSPFMGFFVSPKAKEVLAEYALPSHKYYPVNVIHKEITYSYYFLLIAIDNQPIIYSKSIFIDWMNDDIQLEVDSLEDLLQQKEGNSLFPENSITIYTKENIDEKKIVLYQSLDIYKNIFGIYFYFSEKLKQRIEQEGLTGLQFKEQDDIEFYLDGVVEHSKTIIEEKEKKTEITISTLLSEPLKLLSPSNPYKLPPEITQIEVNEEIKDKGQILTATLFSYYLENEQQIPYKVENIKIQLTSINKSKKLYTFENIEPFMVIWSEKAQHFPKNMKILIKQENVKIVL
jgi:hypothetical protein